MRASGDPVRNVMAQLEATFDASVAKEEETAATDLAVSLQRGMGLGERLRSTRCGLSVLLPDGATTAVSSLASDHLACGAPPALIVPNAAAVTVATGVGTPPEASAETLMQALRPWADRQRRVAVTSSAGTGPYIGRLIAAAPDHLVLEREGARLTIPLGVIGSIRVVPED